MPAKSNTSADHWQTLRTRQAIGLALLFCLYVMDMKRSDNPNPSIPRISLLPRTGKTWVSIPPMNCFRYPAIILSCSLLISLHASCSNKDSASCLTVCCSFFASLDWPFVQSVFCLIAFLYGLFKQHIRIVAKRQDNMFSIDMQAHFSKPGAFARDDRHSTPPRAGNKPFLPVWHSQSALQSAIRIISTFYGYWKRNIFAVTCRTTNKDCGFVETPHEEWEQIFPQALVFI